MATDELVVSIRYQADLESFNNSIAIAERQASAAVARIAPILSSLHQPFDALFQKLGELESSASTITLPNEQVQAFQTLTAQISADTASLKGNLDGVRGSLHLLAPDIQDAIKPLADPQLEQNLDALAKLMSGASGGGGGSGISAQAAAAITTAFGAFLAAATAPVSIPVLLTLTVAGGALGALSVEAGDAIERLLTSEDQSAGSAGDMVARFAEIAKQTEQWAGSQERISDALDPAVEAYAKIEASLKSIKNNAAGLPTFGFGSGTGGGGILSKPRGSNLEERALGGSVYPGVAFLVGERGPEIFVPDRAGRILPNGVLTDSGSGGGLLGDDFDRVIMEIERLGQALDLALVDVPEEVREIAEAMGGTFIQSLEQGRGVMEAMQEAGREAAGQLLHMLLQSEAVRGELGELADVIENVLNQALNGSIDSWEDLGRVALEVLQAIIEKMVEAQQAATKGGGKGGGFLGTILQVAGAEGRSGIAYSAPDILAAA